MALKDKIDNIKDGIWIASLISVPLTAILTVIFFGLWSLYGGYLVDTARQELGIDRNYELILKALGEDRVIRQPDNLSYVEEPVYVGEKLVMTLVMERTEWGKECRITSARAVYIQPNGVTIAGEELPIIRQLSTDLTRLRQTIDAPTEKDRFGQHMLGRWAVYLILDYDCGDDTHIIEETTPLPFMLQKRT